MVDGRVSASRRPAALRGVLQVLVVGLGAAERVAIDATQAAPKIWQAELADVCRALRKLRHHIEKIADEMDEGPAGPPFDPP